MFYIYSSTAVLGMRWMKTTARFQAVFQVPPRPCKKKNKKLFRHFGVSRSCFLVILAWGMEVWAPFPAPCNPSATSLGVRFLKSFLTPKDSGLRGICRYLGTWMLLKISCISSVILHLPELPTGERLQEGFCCCIGILGGEMPTVWEMLEPTKAHVGFFN